MTTFNTIISDARILLQDVSAVRYSQDELLVGANDAVRLVRSIRPDAFLGSFKVTDSQYLATDTFPLAPKYEMAVRQYVAAYAQARESEATLQTFAQSFETHFAGMLKTL